MKYYALLPMIGVLGSCLIGCAPSAEKNKIFGMKEAEWRVLSETQRQYVIDNYYSQSMGLSNRTAKSQNAQVASSGKSLEIVGEFEDEREIDSATEQKRVKSLFKKRQPSEHPSTQPHKPRYKKTRQKLAEEQLEYQDDDNRVVDAGVPKRAPDLTQAGIISGMDMSDYDLPGIEGLSETTGSVELEWFE